MVGPAQSSSPDESSPSRWQDELGPLQILGYYAGIEVRQPLQGDCLREFVNGLKAERDYQERFLLGRVGYLNVEFADGDFSQFLADEMSAFVSQELAGSDPPSASYPPAPWRTPYSEACDLPLMCQSGIFGLLDDFHRKQSASNSLTWEDLRRYFSLQEGMAVFRRPVEMRIQSHNADQDADPWHLERSEEPAAGELLEGFALKEEMELYSVPVLLKSIDLIMKLFEECAVLQRGASMERRLVLQQIWQEAELDLEPAQEETRLSLAAEGLLRQLDRSSDDWRLAFLRRPFIVQAVSALWDQFQLAVALDQEIIKSADSCAVVLPSGGNQSSFRATTWAGMTDFGRESFNRVCIDQLCRQSDRLNLPLPENFRAVLPL